MKRILLPALIIFNFQFSIFNSMQAQDTIITIPPCTIDNWPYGYHLETDGEIRLGGLRGEFGKKFNTKGCDVVGVAAFAVTRPEAYRTYFANNPNEHDNEYSQIYDTTFNECFEYFRLYKRHTDTSTLVYEPWPTPRYVHPDTLEVIASAKMHVLDTNVIGYFDRHAYQSQTTSDRYVPVRVAYFDSAVHLDGEFMAGYTLFNNEGFYDSNGVYYQYKTWTLDLPLISNLASWGTLDDELYRDTVFGCNIYYTNGVPCTAWFSNNPYQMYIAVFPLFCELPVYPSPLVMESSGSGTADATPILSASDFVTLAPNPAINEVNVLSSAGIGTLRVYDLGGRLVYEARDKGMQTSIPIANLPIGIYTVQVFTPLGIAVKKFEKAK